MLVDKLNAFCTVLSDEPLNVYAMAARLGNISAEYLYNLSITPEDSEFSAVSIARHTDSDEVAHVELTLDEPVALDVLETAFGDYEPHHAAPDGAKQVMFRIERANQPNQVALIAVLYDGHVYEITLRRDDK